MPLILELGHDVERAVEAVQEDDPAQVGKSKGSGADIAVSAPDPFEFPRAAAKEYLDGDKAGLRLEQLPGYAPNLNAWDEGRWNHLKNVELRNVVCRDLEELHEQFHLAVARLRQKPRLVRAFFAQAGLPLGGT